MNRNDILNRLNERGYKAEAQDCVKNGVKFEAIVINRGDEQVVPVIYTDEMIESAMAAGKSIENVADSVIEIYEENRNIDFDVRKFVDPKYIPQNVFVGLQKATGENLITRPCGFDGIVAYLYLRGINEKGIFTVKMKKEQLDQAEVDVEQVWKFAETNTFAETRITGLLDRIEEMTDADMGVSDDGIPIYVVSNTSGYLGASAILDSKAITEFCEKIHTEKFVLLPSSIHEFLLIPYEDEMNMEYLSAMVQEVNASEVAPEEQLGDRAFIIEL